MDPPGMESRKGFLEEKTAEDQERIIDSFFRMRKAVGWLGLGLSFGVSLGLLVARASGWFASCEEAESPSSVSAYYHTCMRNLFVGALSAIAVFLFAYRGYANRRGEILSDSVVSKIAAVAALGVAFFPVRPDGAPSSPFHALHLASAVLLFACLIVFSLILFRRGRVTEATRSKRLVYLVCGIVMLLAVAGIGLYSALATAASWLDRYDPVFWLEAIALVAFGVSWLTKGRWLEDMIQGIRTRFARTPDRQASTPPAG